MQNFFLSLYAEMELLLMFLLNPACLPLIPLALFCCYKASLSLPLRIWTKNERLSLIIPVLTIVLPLLIGAVFHAEKFRPPELLGAPLLYPASFVALGIFVAGAIYDIVLVIALRSRCYEILIIAMLHFWISYAAFLAAVFATEGLWF